MFLPPPLVGNFDGFLSENIFFLFSQKQFPIILEEISSDATFPKSFTINIQKKKSVLNINKRKKNLTTSFTVSFAKAKPKAAMKMHGEESNKQSVYARIARNVSANTGKTGFQICGV